jgi:RNA polymerase sigma factor (sigma-70 family)
VEPASRRLHNDDRSRAIPDDRRRCSDRAHPCTYSDPTRSRRRIGPESGASPPFPPPTQPQTSAPHSQPRASAASATWAIIDELARFDRKQRRQRNRAVARYEDGLATGESESERYEREEAKDVCRAAVERLLSRLDGRERRILEYRHGIGGVAEQSLKQFGRAPGISKELVRQLGQRALAELRSLARREAIELASL